MNVYGVDVPTESLWAIVPAVISIMKAFKFVKEGEEGIKLRFGKAIRNSDGTARVYQPGFAVLLPFADSLVTRHVRIQTLELKRQSITIKNGLSYVVDAVLRFRVVKIYNALFVVDDLDTVMQNVGMSTLRNVLTPTEDAEGMANTDHLSAELTRKLKEHEEEWGTEVEEFSIISCVPTSESQQIVNAAAGADIRFKALSGVMGGVRKVFANPQIAAAIIGVPVAVSLGDSGAQSRKTASKPKPEKKSIFSMAVDKDD